MNVQLLIPRTWKPLKRNLITQALGMKLRRVEKKNSESSSGMNYCNFITHFVMEGLCQLMSVTWMNEETTVQTTKCITVKKENLENADRHTKNKSQVLKDYFKIKIQRVLPPKCLNHEMPELTPSKLRARQGWATGTKKLQELFYGAGSRDLFCVYNN